MSPSKFHTGLLLSAVLSGFAIGTDYANPTGPSVVAGLATVQSGAALTIVHQTSNAAIINWQSFSINAGQTTKFIQPSSRSAVLNRVLGGGASTLDGTLGANGQVFLLNQNGVLVGKNGVVDAEGGFTASTRDISDFHTRKHARRFVGHSEDGVKNLGEITSFLGDIVLIGKTVGNHGQINAPRGTVGLVAGDNVFLGQKNADGSNITVNPSPLAKIDPGQVGVQNTGDVNAAAAELKAANGNIYSLAINNSGTIRATTVHHHGGHVWLSSDAGFVENTAGINVSATRKGGTGGSAIIQSTSGTAVQFGSILARGGLGGQGGQVEVSGYTVELSNVIDTRASKGLNGNLIISSNMLDIVTGGTGMVIGSESLVDPVRLQDYLGDGNVTLSIAASITVDSGIAWTASNSLTFQTTGSPGTTLTINAPISGPSLTIQMANPADEITTGANGAISVGSFILANGNWVQNSATLPSFSSTDFELHGDSSFLRAQGGDGSVANPYLISDVYGVQGIGSPSGMYLASNFNGNSSFSEAYVTNSWNGGAGFVPIGTPLNPFQGSLENILIVSLYINAPTGKADYVGLFGVLGSSATVQAVGSTYSHVNGENYVGTIAGCNLGTVSNCNSGLTTYVSLSAGTNQSSDIGGLIGENFGNVVDCQVSSTVTTSSSTLATGLLVGSNAGTIGGSTTEGMVNGGAETGGLAGFNSGTIQNCFAEASDLPTTQNKVSGTDYVGGFVGYSQGGSITNCQTVEDVSATGKSVGGFVGYLGFGTGQVSNCRSANNVIGMGPGVGGFVGDNQGTILNSGQTYIPTIPLPTNVFAFTTITGGSSSTGGFAGSNEGEIEECFAHVTKVTGQVAVGGFVGSNSSLVIGSEADGGQLTNGTLATLVCSGTTMVGGFSGINSGDIFGGSSTAEVQGVDDVGGFVGANSGNYPTIAYSSATGVITATGSNTGGFVGLNDSTGQISGSSFGGAFVQFVNFNLTTGAVTNSLPSVNGDFQVGGFVGQNAGQIQGSTSTQGTVSATSAGGSSRVGGFVGWNTADGQISMSNTVESVVAGSLSSSSSQVGGFVGDNAGSITTSSAEMGSVLSASGGSAIGGFVGSDEVGASITVCYTTENVSAPGCINVGGFSGAEAGSVSTCYSSGQVTGVSPGGFIGLLSGGTPDADYWLQDSSIGINVGLPSVGVGSSGSSGVSPGTQTQLEQASFYKTSEWNFASVWGVNGFSSAGHLNNGLPFFQYLYSTIYQITPGNLTSVYNGTSFGSAGPTPVAEDSYKSSLNGGTVDSSDLAAIAAFNPVFGELTENPNVGINQISLTGATTNSSSVVLEAPASGTLTITPKPITITATLGVSAVYGNPPAFRNDGAAGQLVAGDTLGGRVVYKVIEGNYSAGGYLDVGAYSYTPNLIDYNPNYSVSYVPGTVTITPATLTYIANPATGKVGQMFPKFSGELGGFLPGDSLSNATTGTLSFTTSASGTSPAGSYSIDGNGLSASNYIFVQDPTNATAFTLAPKGIPNPTNSAGGTGLVIVTSPGSPSTESNQPSTVSFTAFPSSLLSNAEAAIIGPPSIYPDFAGSSNPYLYNGKGSGQIVNGTNLQEFKKKKRYKKVAK